MGEPAPDDVPACRVCGGVQLPPKVGRGTARYVVRWDVLNRAVLVSDGTRSVGEATHAAVVWGA